MPRILPYEQQTRTPQPTGAVPRLDTSTGTLALGEAFESIAQDQVQLKAFERKKAEERAAVAANDSVMSLRSRWAEELPKRQQAAPAGAEGFTPGILKDFDTEAEAAIKAAPTEASRNWLKDRLGHVRLAIQQDALGFEARKGVEFKVDGLARAADQARTAAEFRPQDFQAIAAEQIAAIDASGLPAEARAKLLQDSTQAIASASVQGMIRRNPYTALKELNSEGTKEMAVRALSFDARQTLRNQAEAEIRRIEAERKATQIEARQALTDRARDIMAAAELGLPITEAPSRSEFVTAFGEREGDQRYKAVQLATRLSGEVAGLNQLPTAELLKRAETFKPTDVAGAADQAPMYAFLNRSAANILTAREKDPGGYLVQHSPTVKSAWTALTAAEPDAQPAAAERYLRAVRAERERLGITATEVLPERYAEELVAQLTQPQGNETLAARMAAETQRWGPAWPSVYRQLAKALPDTALVIGSGIPARAANALAGVSQLKDDQLKARIETTGTRWRDLEERVDGELEDLADTFGAEGAPTLNAIRSSAHKLTAAYMAQGSSLSDAAEQATKDLANERYTFQDFRGRAYRVPVAIDPDVVDEGATAALARFHAETGTVPVVPGQPEEILLGQATEQVRRKGYWVTSPDESGLRLYLNGQPVPTASGRPVQYTWEQLRELAIEVSEQQAAGDVEDAAARNVARGF